MSKISTCVQRGPSREELELAASHVAVEESNVMNANRVVATVKRAESVVLDINVSSQQSKRSRKSPDR